MNYTSTAESRRKELQQITSVIDNSLCAFKAVVKELGWSEDSIIVQPPESEEIVTCPLDSGHRMPKRSLEKHLETCSWVKKGYTREEKEKALPSSHFFYENSASVFSVLIDKELQFKIFSEAAKNGQLDLGGAAPSVKDIPLTVDRCITELTPQERFAIYDYVVSQSKSTNKRTPFSLEDLQINFDEKPREGELKKSRIEILAELRDYKRRRQSYRAKNVHITRKSYSEILQEVIQNQMDYLQHMLKVEDVADDSETKSGKRLKSRDSKHSGQSEGEGHSSTERKEHKVHHSRHQLNDSRSHRHRSRSRERAQKRPRYSSDNESDASSGSVKREADGANRDNYDHETRKKKHKKHKHKKHKHKKHKKHNESDDD